MLEKLVGLGLTTEQAQKVVDNLGSVLDGQYVTKVRFNEVNEELKTSKATIAERDTQLETLKNSTGDVEALKKTVTDLQAANKQAKIDSDKALAEERKSNAIKLELNGKVHNVGIAMSQLKLDEIVMDEQGNVKSGLKEQLDALKKSDSYLFIPEGDGQEGNNNGGTTPPVLPHGAKPKDGTAAGQVSETFKGENFAKNLAKSANQSVAKNAEALYFGGSAPTPNTNSK